LTFLQSSRILGIAPALAAFRTVTLARMAILTTKEDKRDNICVAFSCFGDLQDEDRYGK
jgi:hypothetical protein